MRAVLAAFVAGYVLGTWAPPAAPAAAAAAAAFPAGWYRTTAYCCVGIGGGYCGHTALGTQVRAGVVAGPPALLGATVDIPGYGVAVIEDTGGALWGNRLDVFFLDCAEAWAWGARNVYVTPTSSDAPLVADAAETWDDTEVQP